MGAVVILESQLALVPALKPPGARLVLKKWPQILRLFSTLQAGQEQVREEGEVVGLFVSEGVLDKQAKE